MGGEESKRVLVVDDEEDVRAYLRTALEDAGFRVETACDGFEALEAVKRARPDLISLDLVMPKRSGAKFYRDLQKSPEWREIPVLIVTGHARDELGRADFEELTMSGPGIYLEKPVRPGNYVRAVRRLLGMEEAGEGEGDPERLRGEVEKRLKDADLDALQKALDALKKR
ncbi:MAG TPA: response regulator [Bacteroidetes bacterium]|nr:response regulator [Bacteroidota bacterium]